MSGKTTKRFQDLSGFRFGRLLVKSLAAHRERSTSWWFCVCDCGAEKRASAAALRAGKLQSCGCLRREMSAAHIHRKTLPPGEAAFRAMFGSYARSAKQRRIAFDLTEDEFRSITKRRCHYCGASPSKPYSAGPATNGVYLASGVDRFENDLGYTRQNSRPCCQECNMAKGRMSATRWMAWLTRIAIQRAPGIRDRDGRPFFIPEIIEADAERLSA